MKKILSIIITFFCAHSINVKAQLAETSMRETGMYTIRFDMADFKIEQSDGMVTIVAAPDDYTTNGDCDSPFLPYYNTAYCGRRAVPPRRPHSPMSRSSFARMLTLKPIRK